MSDRDNSDRNNTVMMPSEVSEETGFFDRFAEAAARFASRAYFFAFCVLLIVVWAPSILLIQSIDTWQLIINTATTIITFLMVALLQNSQSRNDQALQHKLNAVADALSDLMAALGDQLPDSNLHDDVRELKLAVGLEDRESTTGNASDDGDHESDVDDNASEAQSTGSRVG